MSRPVAVFLLLLTTAIWGLAFVAQKFATAAMAPLTFIAVRYLLGGLCVLPLALREYRRRHHPVTPRQGALLLLFTAIFFAGSWLQQAGLMTTTVTNAGFLTGLYVLFVPIILFAVFRQMPHPILWVGTPLALAGIYFLNGGLHRLHPGDALIVASAVCWACQILLLGHLARATGLPIFVSAVCFIGAGLLSAVGASILETPTLSGMVQGWIPIAYSAVFSTAIAFSFQAIAQQHVPSANVAIILSAESLFACLGGALLLGERLPAAGYFGATLIFLAIILVESIPALSERRRANPAPPGH
ncbi:MAG: DMT family transporter [Chthoniobacterales bacterium]